MRKAWIVVILCLLMIAPSVGGPTFAEPPETPTDTGNVPYGTRADPGPAPEPSWLVRLGHEWDPDLEYDRLELQTYNADTQAFDLVSFNLSTPEWKEKAIEFLSTSQLNPDLNCYIASEYTKDCQMRDKAWDVLYPYANSIWLEMASAAVEILLHYFDPWDQLSLGTVPMFVEETNSTAMRLFNETGPMTHEPIILKALAKIWRGFIDSIALSNIGKELGLYEPWLEYREDPLINRADIEVPFFLWNARFYLRSMRSFMNQTYEQNWTTYIVQTDESLNDTVDNITAYPVILEELEVMLNPFVTDVDFSAVVDEYHNLEINLNFLRTGIRQWGLDMHLAHELTWFYMGGLRGYITDQETGDPIYGVNIMVASVNFTNWGYASTDKTGYYQIMPLPQGTYHFVIEKDGYTDPGYKFVTINAFEVTNMDISLAPDGYFHETTQDIQARSSDNNIITGALVAIAFCAVVFVILMMSALIQKRARKKNEAPHLEVDQQA